jgi:hypothetical protein
MSKEAAVLESLEGKSRGYRDGVCGFGGYLQEFEWARLAEEKCRFLLALASSFVLLPWLAHYSMRFLILPITRWIASGFKSAGDGDAP